jgi:tetratricopeptide (TPR) repeat protein
MGLNQRAKGFFSSPFAGEALLAALVLIAFAPGLSGVFLLDDEKAILSNPSLREPFSLAWLRPPPDTTVEGRPLVNASLALCHAFCGTRPFCYHVFNVLVHLGAALALLGVVRAVLSLSRWPAPVRESARPLALGAALLWSLHPLQTESVTYIVQRAEAMMGACYLLVLYALARAATSATPRGSRGWSWACVAACAAGMACKEVMVSAPVMALLFDRVFFARSWSELWRARGLLHLGLALSWTVLLVLLSSRSGSAGFSTGVASQSYALAQVGFLARYVRLFVWPSDLVLDYGPALHLAEGSSLLLVGLALFLLLAVGWIWRRSSWAGYLLAFFFAVLAPSSSFVPVATQVAAEHRMYLALAPLSVLAVLGAGCLVRAATRRDERLALAARLFGCALIGVLMVLTMKRNREYSSEVVMWSGNVARWPINARAHVSLAVAHRRGGELELAMEELERAIALDPESALAYRERGALHQRQGRLDAAASDYERSLAIGPSAEAYSARGLLRRALGQFEAARADCNSAIALAPNLPEPYWNRALILCELGAFREALADLETYKRLGGSPGAGFEGKLRAAAANAPRN